MKSKFVELDGVRFNYGEGRPNGRRLVFLPGFPRYWSEYRPLLDMLEPHYHLFALSMRGQGLSQRSPPYTIASYITDTIAFLRGVVGGGALGIGHSAGAWFGLAAANDFPDLFSAFVSIDQPLNPEDHVIAHGTDVSAVGQLLAALRAARDVDELKKRLSCLLTSNGRSWAEEMDDREILERAHQLSKIDPETFAPWANGLENWIMVAELQRWPGQYRAPLLFLDGDPDAGSMLTASAVHYNLSRYPWAQRVELKGHDHIMGLRSDPERSVAEIRSFFGSLV